MLQPAEAAAAIAASLGVLPVESCRLADAAGRVLRADVYAEREQPPFDRVAMDGIAISSAAGAGGRRSFRVAGVVAAGAPPATLGDPADCLEVMTGAVLPPGADAVERRLLAFRVHVGTQHPAGGLGQPTGFDRQGA